MKVIVTNIQRFCLHDGPGIRTTVFFKGCNLRCPWCANPENIEFDIQEYVCGTEQGKYGYAIDLNDLEKEILKDENFYGDNGGVTFSGGEPLLQFNNIEPLLKSLKDKSINICIETALMVKEEIVDIALKYVDEFIIDIKILEKERCKAILNGEIDLYYKNIETVFLNKKNVVFRIPIVEEYTYDSTNIELIIQLLKKYKPKKVEIFNVHNLAIKKYESLNKTMPTIKGINKGKLFKLKSEIEDLNILVEICNI